ncbi:MAG: biopolymer transporter ExbD [Planctomycetes bacterium]|nr:biopolymer transporter ExbD [Planctomycetota bacterium]
MKHYFRNRSARAVHEQHAGPNMTPMVDVVMVILIFFMASAAILGPEWFLKSALPVVGGSAAASKTTRIKITVARGPDATPLITITAGDAPPKESSLSGLAAILAALPDKSNAIALVSPSADVPYDWVVRVHEACAQAGIARVGLAE